MWNFCKNAPLKIRRHAMKHDPVLIKEVLPETLDLIKKTHTKNKVNEILFAPLSDARMLRMHGFRKLVVLVDSFEHASAAISEGFSLAFREYVWEKKDSNETFRGFQFFTHSKEEALEIQRIIPYQGVIPEEDPSRVTFGMLPKNVSLRWLAERFIMQH